MKCSLGISNFLEEIFCIDHWRRLSYLSLLFFGTLHSNGNLQRRVGGRSGQAVTFPREPAEFCREAEDKAKCDWLYPWADLRKDLSGWLPDVTLHCRVRYSALHCPAGASGHSSLPSRSNLGRLLDPQAVPASVLEDYIFPKGYMKILQAKFDSEKDVLRKKQRS